MSNLKVCKKCDSNDIEVDRARGITYCTNCGNVLEESIIVSEVQIEEGSGGGMNVVGQFVGSNDTRGISINGLQHSLRESKEITLQNGKKLINEMGSQLRLNQHCMDTAFNFYKLAVQRGLTRGRKIRQVIAACLYLVCRTENTPHMLLDLCDIVHDDSCYISSLGKLAMKFAYLLCIKLPEIDPGLFIPRFAQKLDFGEKTNDVTTTALRLVQRMNRDWMATGRRPSGLCGAALLVSARMYDFERSLDDIVKVVKIGKTTLRKRMLEFEDTPSSNLTVDEFHTIDLEEEHDPPAYTRSRKFAKIKQIEEMANIQEIEKEIMRLQENIEAALNDLSKPRGMIAKYAKLCEFENEILGPNKDVTNVESEIKEAEEFLSEEQINLIRSIVADDELIKSQNKTLATVEQAAESTTIKLVDDNNKWNNLRPTLRSLGIVRETNENYNEKKNEDEDDDDVDADDDLDLEDDDFGDESDEFDEEEFENDDDENAADNNDDDDDDAIDLASIRRRRRQRKLKILKRRKEQLKLSQTQSASSEKILIVNSENSQTASIPSIRQAPEPEPEPEPESTRAEVTVIEETSKKAESVNQEPAKTIESASNNQTTEDTVPTAASKSSNNNSNQNQTQSEKEKEKDQSKEDEIDLTGIDDSEIDSMILSRDEIKTKAKLWLRANKDWLKEQKEKEDQKKKEKEESKSYEPKPKKPRIRKPKNTTPVSNPQEAIERMLQEKKLSSKINYDVLKNLNKDLKRT